MSDKTSKRKASHIDLAYQSQVNEVDNRFNYEPLLAAHPSKTSESFSFLGKQMKHPLWVSSMTGGTEKAGKINRNLGKAAGKYGLGMGLGSCRILLESDEYLADFQLRKHIGDDAPFYANLGIAQVEELVKQGHIGKVTELVHKLDADGLIVHINPFQEWLQPEGDKISVPPLETLKRLIDAFDGSIVVKEVGQGFGPESLRALLELPISGIEFGAHGGTNFSALELLRSDKKAAKHYSDLTFIGHTAGQMVDLCNDILNSGTGEGKEFIISGGIRNFLDGYYYRSKLQANSVYAQASALLKPAEKGFDELDEYIEKQMAGYQLAEKFLTIKK